MQRLFYFALLVVIACSGIDTFEVKTESTTTVEGATILEQLAGDIGFSDLVTFDLKETAAYRNQDVKENEIDSVRLTLIQLDIESPEDGVDFTFLDDLEFYVEAPGQPRVRIARGGPFETGQKSIVLELDNVNLKPYVLEETMSITTEVTGRSPSEDTVVKADVRFDVNIDVSGAICG